MDSFESLAERAGFSICSRRSHLPSFAQAQGSDPAPKNSPRLFSYGAGPFGFESHPGSKII